MNKGNWVPIDKTLVKTMSSINRPFSVVEAMFSYSVDQDCCKEGTLRGYAKLWGWSVGKVKRFVDCLRNTSETVVERKGNGNGTLVRFVDGSLKRLAEQKRNGSGTVTERKRVATIYPNPKPNPKPKKKTCVYSPEFESFWTAYPKKIGKGAAYKAWVKIDTSNGMVTKILNAISLQKKSEGWIADNGQFIPHPTTWLNQDRWLDEVEEVKSKSAGYDACESLF